MQLDALLRLAFTAAPRLLPLNLTLHTLSRRLILQKARYQAISIATGYPLTACKLKVSGSAIALSGYFSPFPHGTIRYRSLVSILSWIVVYPDSNRVSRAPPYSGTKEP